MTCRIFSVAAWTWHQWNETLSIIYGMKLLYFPSPGRSLLKLLVLLTLLWWLPIPVTHSLYTLPRGLYAIRICISETNHCRANIDRNSFDNVGESSGKVWLETSNRTSSFDKNYGQSYAQQIETNWLKRYIIPPTAIINFYANNVELSLSLSLSLCTI